MLVSITTKSKENVVFPAKELFSGGSGTLMFWFKPNWNGKLQNYKNFISYPLFSGLDANGKNKVYIFMWNWLRADLARDEGKESMSVNNHIRSAIYEGDWTHICLVWNKQKTTKLFVNGISYSPSYAKIKDIDLSSITEICLGKQGLNRSQTADSTFDELKIYKRPLSDTEVSRAYRDFMPIDIILDKSIVFSNQDETLPLLLAPGGFYERPKLSLDSDVKAEIDITVGLYKDDVVIKEIKKKLNIDKPQTLNFPVGKLPEGNYVLRCNIITSDGTIIQRSFPITSHKFVATPVTNSEGLTKGELIYEKVFTNGDLSSISHDGDIDFKTDADQAYLEAGKNKEDRFAVEITFPDKFLNKTPVLIELTWPDNKPRSMGLYMYPESDRRELRDRLEGGIQSGNEYPLTKQIQKTQYIFYPGIKRYLLEARTMIENYPAALCSVKIFSIKKRLPKLQIIRPKSLPYRRLGYLDEDQTFDLLMNYNEKDRSRKPLTTTIERTEILCDYLDYTGQNVFSYPIMRYDMRFYEYSGSTHTKGLFPYVYGGIDYFIRRLNQRGINFIGTINWYTLPDLSLASDQFAEQAKKGYVIYDSNGEAMKFWCGPKVNLFNPHVKKLFLNNIETVIKRHGNTPGFVGLDWWLGQGTISSLDQGYGEYTTQLFSKETGIQIPDAFRQTAASRCEFLTKKVRKEWLSWRSNKYTLLIQSCIDLMHRYNKNLKLNIVLGGSPLDKGVEDSCALSDFYYEQWAINMATINKINDVYLVPLSRGNMSRWYQHWGKNKGLIDETLYNPSTFKPFLKDGIGYANIYNTYFETFKDPLKSDIYKNYFQNADIKPFGRYFLKAFSFSLATMDAQRILIGAQPIGTSGRDDVTREFAKAYGALPEGKFASVSGFSDSFAVRYLNTSEGCYFYAVSLLWKPCEISVNIDKSMGIKDLSSGIITENRDKEDFHITLKPYQLRSFLIKGENVKLTKGDEVFSPELNKYYSQKLELLKKAIAVMKEQKSSSKVYSKCAMDIEQALKNKNYPEAHRLIFSEKSAEIFKLNASGFLKEKLSMLANSQYALNCGAKEFARSKSGTLFFSDQKFTEGKSYGYLGRYEVVTRNVGNLKKNADAFLFQSEAYCIDSYRFKVKPGKYKVRLYFKVGYEPGAKLGNFVFNVVVEGKEKLNKFDVFEKCYQKFENITIQEFPDIEVNDGILNINFSADKGKDLSAKFCNAIEVIPMK